MGKRYAIEIEAQAHMVKPKGAEVVVMPAVSPSAEDSAVGPNPQTLPE